MNEDATWETENYTCGEGEPVAPCTKPLGNTEQGLCDMSGSMYEWVADAWHANYSGAPADGSAWMTGTGNEHVIRGGSFHSMVNTRCLATTGRYSYEYWDPDLGFRCARETDDTDADAGIDSGL